MELIGTMPPAVTATAYKRAVHIMPEEADDDALVEGYLLAAQMTVEEATRRPLTQRVLRISTRATGWRRWWLPICPVHSVSAIKWQGENGQWVALDHAAARLEMGQDEPQLVVPELFWAGVADGAPVAVDVMAGMTACDHRHPLGQAVILLVKDWYEAGLSVETKEFLNVSFGCRAIMKQRRYTRPREFSVC